MKENSKEKISEDRFRKFSEISCRIAEPHELRQILANVLDAALEMTQAERGFLLLKKEGSDGPFPGFEVEAARGSNGQALSPDEFHISFSSILQAVRQNEPLLTDNAQEDPLFMEKVSVRDLQIQSILIAPLSLNHEGIGVIYLDHRLKRKCFTEEDVLFLQAFSAQAALAIQKARLLKELKEANSNLEKMIQRQSQKIGAMSGEIKQLRSQLHYDYREIVGQSPKMMKMFELLDHVTDTNIPVWICGESGTGKELVARSLHFNSSRKNGPFISENCSALVETLLESELFGHKKGAFTHAERDQTGLFEQAHGGTLFLDEIADMSLSMQAKLLRVLQEGEIRPLGSSKKIKVDFRLVTACNQDLIQLVQEGRFRHDLFFRINGLTLKLPPLRERKDDIPVLINHFIQKICHRFGLPVSELSDEAYRFLIHHEWPGNVRELEGLLHNALLFSKGRLITPELLSIHPRIDAARREEKPEKIRRSENSEERQAEKQLIIEALIRHKMNKASATQELGISLKSLYNKMELHQIPKKKTVLAKFLGIKAGG